jgi:hypothetical protein
MHQSGKNVSATFSEKLVDLNHVIYRHSPYENIKKQKVDADKSATLVA